MADSHKTAVGTSYEAVTALLNKCSTFPSLIVMEPEVIFNPETDYQPNAEAASIISALESKGIKVALLGMADHPDRFKKRMADRDLFSRSMCDASMILQAPNIIAHTTVSEGANSSVGACCSLRSSCLQAETVTEMCSKAAKELRGSTGLSSSCTVFLYSTGVISKIPIGRVRIGRCSVAVSGGLHVETVEISLRAFGDSESDERGF
ncbi:hypothetical protein CEUSTIGMA_g3845.t1 [Chlamydomonas eustigma]|uniref:Uncharacterized protein n=1 Tax=Chlamydomonas eustigma TaxID=1157962 RepID=A0A250X0X3_9CHLO|nr:hypothetical protein CEUSTIGMA_g3845.t1 [Chlamydomonas eustigma]|eukprot:GAX76400.1 hypothetical protein CEUSTIGMA_g3845.t1 [Chlamydomonas eustigma]